MLNSVINFWQFPVVHIPTILNLSYVISSFRNLAVFVIVNMLG
jgi:hypothetical protein